MKLFKTALSLSLLTMSTFAVSANYFDKLLTDESKRLDELRSSTAGDRNADPSCKSRYGKIFNKKTIKISFGFGYGDARPNSMVWDHYVYSALVKKLKGNCPLGVVTCGFSESKTEKDLFRKIVEGPTGETNSLIELRITKPSLSGDNSINMSSANAEKQMLTCAAANNKFMSEIANGADIVFYYGHSRDGGGPDFCPAKTLSNDHVNYPYYRKNQPGFKNLLNAMELAKTNKNPNKVIGLFSCSSGPHFYKRMLKVNSSAGYIVTSRTATFHELSMDAYASLDNLLSQRCADGFEDTFAPRKATVLENMF